jgi:hypothetical protein
MATVDELYADLDASIPASGGDMMAGASDASLVPSGILTSALLTWATQQVLRLTCEQRPVIEAAARQWISTKVKNQVLANVLIEALAFTLDRACPVAS